MINPKIVSEVIVSKQKGVADAQIVESLIKSGYTKVDIDAAFAGIEATRKASLAQSYATPPVQPLQTVQETTVATSPAPTPVSVAPFSPTANILAPVTHKKHLGLIIIGIAVLVLIAGTTLAYTRNIGPFARGMYGENNLFSGLLLKSAMIDSSSYAVSLSLNVEPREADAFPFAMNLKEDPASIAKYKNDYKRAQAVDAISSLLNYSTSYPANLSGMEKDDFYGDTSEIDPTTNLPYKYKTTEGGKNFSLEVTFETTEAIKRIKEGYQFKEETTLINGQTVTFTKDSTSYLFLSEKPPEPFFVGLNEMARNLPAEMKVDMAVSAKVDMSTEEMADWTLNLDANGDFGDLQYKVNFDALKKDSNYFLKINNMPSLFFSQIGGTKNQWVKINSANKAEATDEYSFNSMDSLSKQFAESEASYKENRQKLSSFIKKVAQLADEEKLVSFKKNPSKESVNGRDLYRYDLFINKEAILPFYEKLSAEVARDPNLAPFAMDEGLLDELRSKDFDQTFDYYQKNTSITVWADKTGYPAMMEYSIRMVPPDTATQLKDKQAKITLRISIDDINKPIDIKAPENTKTLEEFMGGSPLDEARMKGTNAAIKASLSNTRASAELYYDKNQGYGKSSLTGDCNIAGTIFADKDISAMITSVKTKQENTKDASLVCYGSPSAWALSAQVPTSDETKEYWCVDSTGASKMIFKPISSTQCQ